MKKITKENLKEMYYNNPNTYVCEKLGITNGTLVTLLQENDIELKGARGRVKKVVVVD